MTRMLPAFSRISVWTQSLSLKSLDHQTTEVSLYLKALIRIIYKAVLIGDQQNECVSGTEQELRILGYMPGLYGPGLNPQYCLDS